MTESSSTAAAESGDTPQSAGIPSAYAADLGDALENPAVAWNDTQSVLFVHGGRLQQHPHIILSTLVSYSVRDSQWRVHGAPAQLQMRTTELQSRAGTQSDAAPSSLESVFSPLRQSLGSLLSLTASSSSSASSDYDARVLNPLVTAPPQRCDHIAFVWGSSLILHGGRRPARTRTASSWQEVECNDFSAFHTRSGMWESLSGLIGGCAAPYMYGHAAVKCGDDSVIVIGPVKAQELPREADASGRRRRRGKRERERADGSTRPPASSADSALRVYRLTLGAELVLEALECASALPRDPQRRHFHLACTTPRETLHATAAAAALSHSAVDPLEDVVYLAGGVVGSRRVLHDVWMFSTQTRVWREILIPQPSPTPVGLPGVAQQFAALMALPAAAVQWGSHESEASMMALLFLRRGSDVGLACMATTPSNSKSVQQQQHMQHRFQELRIECTTNRSAAGTTPNASQAPMKEENVEETSSVASWMRFKLLGVGLPRDDDETGNESSLSAAAAAPLNPNSRLVLVRTRGQVTRVTMDPVKLGTAMNGSLH